MLSNFTRTLFFTLSCRNSPMRYNCYTLAFWLEPSSRKYFRVLIYPVGDQVSRKISLFFNYPLTTILNFNLSILPSDCIFDLYTSIHGFHCYSFLGSFIRNVWLLIKFIRSFKVVFSQAFFASAGNMMTSTNFLGSGIKWDTAEPDSLKVENGFFNSFTTSLNNLCKPLPIFFA